MKKIINIIGGGTVAPVVAHLALCAPAYGTTAKQLAIIVRERFGRENYDTNLTLTKMAGGNDIETNTDVGNWIEKILKETATKIVFFNVACVDYKAHLGDKYGERFDSREGSKTIQITPQPKFIKHIRGTGGRKEIFLVGFKNTCGATEQAMFEAGLRLCKDASCNLVLVNDSKTRLNMIVTPEEATYKVTTDRLAVLEELVDMTWYRSQLTFTQSTVVDGKLISWYDERIPKTVVDIIEYCIDNKAYKSFNGGGTVGHFAVKLDEKSFLTSIRKSNFNNIQNVGMVLVKTDGPDTVLAFGAKPSVGGQSQRTVFRDHPGYDCIVHFHCPLRLDHKNTIPIVSQKEVECGSHQCGENTSKGLAQFGNLQCVMLDNHGPNILFPSNIDPKEVIDFIEANFDLAAKTGGYNL